MTTFIYITGSGITSKSVLLNSFNVYSDQIANLPFNNFKLKFRTKGEAVRALSKAYQNLISDFDTKNSTEYSRSRFLNYDAGTARIESAN
jgi:hypothetical protein